MENSLASRQRRFLQDVDRTMKINLVEKPAPLGPKLRKPREMTDRVAAGHGLFHGGAIANVSLNIFDSNGPVPIPRGKLIEYPHGSVCADERMDEMPAKKPGSPRNQNERPIQSLHAAAP